ncbi:Ceramide synthase 6, partial [Ophiophagus hannah]
MGTFQVAFKQFQGPLQLTIIEGNLPSFLGLDWFDALGLRVTGIHIIPDDSIEELIQVFADVFDDRLGNSNPESLQPHVPGEPGDQQGGICDSTPEQITTFQGEFQQVPGAGQEAVADPAGLTAVSNLNDLRRFIAKPCALGLKVQANGPQKAQPNAILEKVFTAITKHPDEKRLEGLSKQLDWDVRSIQRWFRQRRNQEKPSILRKFCESL